MPDYFDLSSFGLAPRFPATRLESAQDCLEFLRSTAEILDSRYGYEQSLAVTGRELVQQGTCAPCLRPVRFVSDTGGGETLKDGRLVPNWREGMRCDCAFGLINRQRAVMHFLQVNGLARWAHVLLFGPASGTDAFLTRQVRRMHAVERLQYAEGAFTLGLATESCQLAVSQDYLQFVPPLGVALAEIYRVLVAGGSFVFTVPFMMTAKDTVPISAALMAGAKVPLAEFRGGQHGFAWDLLDMLRVAGFGDAAAYCYWSEELGYLGAFNLVFRAVK